MNQEILFKKGTVEWYRRAFEIMKLDAGCEKHIANAAKKVWLNMPHYREVASRFGIMPWYFVGAIHSLEASCSFRGVLHNGERIIGTGEQTKLVPMGRGPFDTWEDAAYDALNMKGLHHITEWGIGNLLKIAEAYNGTGYLRFHPTENSPYLWAMSSLNDGTGKYTSDGKWDENAPSEKQVGLAVVLKQLQLTGIITIE